MDSVSSLCCSPLPSDLLGLPERIRDWAWELQLGGVLVGGKSAAATATATGCVLVAEGKAAQVQELLHRLRTGFPGRIELRAEQRRGGRSKGKNRSRGEERAPVGRRFNERSFDSTERWEGRPFATQPGFALVEGLENAQRLVTTAGDGGASACLDVAAGAALGSAGAARK